MADKRNNDWTDALRERLSSSELAPATDIWSEVERAATEVPGPHRTLPKPFWWAAGCMAAAALAAIIILPDAGRNGSLQVDPHPQTAASQIAQAAYTQAPEPSSPVNIPETVASVPQRPYRPSAVLPVESFDAMPSQEETETPLTASSSFESQPPMTVSDTSGSTGSQEDDSRPVPSVSRRPVEDLLFDDIPDDAPKRERRLSASLFAAGFPGAYGTNSVQGVDTDGLGNLIHYGEGSYVSGLNGDIVKILQIDPSMKEIIWKKSRHHRPVSLGVTLSYPLSGKLFLESGLVYSFLRSEYPISLNYPGGTSDQNLHFLGIPLKMGYRFTTPSRFSVSLSAGAMAEKCIYGEALGKKVSLDGTQFSAVASAAVQYRMADRLSLFLSPEWSYYFTETELPTYRTETPFGMTLRLGLNLDLGL